MGLRVTCHCDCYSPNTGAANRCKQDDASRIVSEDLQGLSPLTKTLTTIKHLKMYISGGESLSDQIQHPCPGGENDTGVKLESGFCMVIDVPLLLYSSARFGSTLVALQVTKQRFNL